MGQVGVDMAVLLEVPLTYSNETINSHLKQNTELQIYFFFQVRLHNSQCKVKQATCFGLNRPSSGL